MIKSRKAISIIAIIMLLLLPLTIFSGCSKEKSFEGEICKLEYKEEYTTIIPLTTYIYNGKTMTPIITYYVRTYPDRWYVQVRRFNTNKQKYEYDECYVTQECFAKLKIGDWFVYDKDFCYSEEPYTQVRRG